MTNPLLYGVALGLATHVFTGRIAPVLSRAALPGSTPVEAEAGRPTVYTPPTQLSVTFVLKDAFQDARLMAYVRRTAGPTGASYVVLKRSALTPELVLAATKNLWHAVSKFGVIGPKQVSVYMLLDYHRRAMAPRDREWAQGVIAQLLAASPHSISRIGTHRAVTILVDAP